MDGINDFGITYENENKPFYSIISESKLSVNYKFINSNITNASKIYKSLDKNICGVFIFPDNLSFSFTKKTGISLCKDLINYENFILYGVTDINKLNNFKSVVIFILYLYDKTIELLNNNTQEEKEICKYLHEQSLENTKKIASLLSMGDNTVKNCYSKYEYNHLYNRNKTLRSLYILDNISSNVLEFMKILPTFNLDKIDFYMFDCPVPIIYHDLISNFLEGIKLYEIDNSELYEIMKNERYGEVFKEIIDILNI